MEVVVGKVRLQPRPRVAVGVDRDEDREHVAPAALEPLEHRPHLVELVGADVGAHREPEVQKRVLPLQVGGVERGAVGVGASKREVAAEGGSPRARADRLLQGVQPPRALRLERVQETPARGEGQGEAKTNSCADG